MPTPDRNFLTRTFEEFLTHSHYVYGSGPSQADMGLKILPNQNAAALSLTTKKSRSKLKA